MTNPSTKIYRILKIGFLLVFLVTLLHSCRILSIGANNLYESFYTGDAGTQYFIKPITFKNSNSEELIIDIIFRFNQSITNEDTARINFSIKSNSLVKEVDSLTLANKQISFKGDDIERLFMERDNRQYLSRFSSSAPLGPLSKLFISDQWTIEAFYENKKSSFFPTSPTQRKIRKLNYNLFELIREN